MFQPPFVFSDGWSDRYDVVENFEEEAVGGLSVRIHSPYVHEFDPYYFGLSPYTNHRNPWFREFWQWKFNCSLHSLAEMQSLTMEERMKAMQLPRCTGHERLSDRYKQDTKMAFVIKAIWTMAYGLHSMHRTLCPNSTFLCKEMIPVNGSVRLLTTTWRAATLFVQLASLSIRTNPDFLATSFERELCVEEWARSVWPKWRPTRPLRYHELSKEIERKLRLRNDW